MSKMYPYGRRRFLRDAAVGSFGALLGTGCVLAARRRSADDLSVDGAADARRRAGEAAQDAPDRGDPRALVSHALSLAALQRQARRARESGVPIPDAVARLDGITAVRGWMREGDDVLLLGSRDPRWPALQLNDLAVALRNTYQVADVYRQAPGCSIDPRRGEADPWSIQDVRVFGMPFDCDMASRFVAVDYEMKQAAAGIVSIGRVPSLCDLAKRDLNVCAEVATTGPAREMAHRLWFCPAYPASSRFALEEDCALIERPVGVHVLTEEEFFDARGSRVGAGPPDAAANEFVAAISRLLVAPARRAYAALVGDFRLIEAAKLLRKTDGRVRGLSYLLEEHEIARTAVPRYVAGVRRREHVEVTCGGEVSERQVSGRQIIESRVMNRRHRYRFEGGVTVDIDLPDGQPVRPPSNETAALRRRILAARPGGDAVGWAVSA